MDAAVALRRRAAGGGRHRRGLRRRVAAALLHRRHRRDHARLRARDAATGAPGTPWSEPHDAAPAGPARRGGALPGRPHAAAPPRWRCPRPYLLGQRMWDPERSRAAYPTREAFMRALVPVLRGELLAVQAAGVTVAQFDDPHLCLLVDPKVRARLRRPDARGRALRRPAQRDRGGRRRHRDRGAPLPAQQGPPGLGRRGRLRPDPAVPAPARRYGSTCSSSPSRSRATSRCSASCRDDRQIGLGCVDCRGAHIDGPEVIADRVDAGAAPRRRRARLAQPGLRLRPRQRGRHPDRRGLRQAPQRGGRRRPPPLPPPLTLSP